MAKKNAPKSLIVNPSVSATGHNVIGAPKDHGNFYTVTLQIPVGSIESKDVPGKEGVQYHRAGSVTLPPNHFFVVDGVKMCFVTTSKRWDAKNKRYIGVDSISVKPYTEPKAREEKDMKMPAMG